jgi:peptidase E
MIKFVLHGGNTSEVNRDNNNFFKEMTVSNKKRLRILLNYFARDKYELNEVSGQDIKRFKKLSVVENLNFEIAQPGKLSEQLKYVDVMYIRGGSTERLMKQLLLTKDFEKCIDGKTIRGSSAGVYVLAKYFYSNDSKIIGKGLGILNIKTYCHYEPTDIKIVNKLASYKEKLPLLILPNYKWVVMYK